MSTLKIEEILDPCIIQALSGDLEYEREFTLIYPDGHVSFLRRPECADYWLHEEYGTQLQEIKEKWTSMSKDDTLYDLLGEGKAWNTELDDPSIILPDYDDLVQLPVGALVILGMEFSPEPDLMHGLIFEPRFMSLIQAAEKAIGRVAEGGDSRSRELLNYSKTLSDNIS